MHERVHRLRAGRNRSWNASRRIRHNACPEHCNPEADAAVVSTRDSTSSVLPKLSAKDIAPQIRHEKGFLDFWTGYSASLVLTLNPAITFLLHKVSLRTLVPRLRRADPGVCLTFLIAATSGLIASSITYPF